MSRGRYLLRCIATLGEATGETVKNSEIPLVGGTAVGVRKWGERAPPPLRRRMGEIKVD